MPNSTDLVPYPVYRAWAFAHQLHGVVMMIYLFSSDHPRMRQHTAYMLRTIDRLLKHIENHRLVAPERLNPSHGNYHQLRVHLPLLQYVYFNILTGILSRSIRTLRRLMRRQRNRQIPSFVIMYI